MGGRARIVGEDAGQVVQRVGHLRVFPIDEVHAVGGQHVAVVKIAVNDAGRTLAPAAARQVASAVG
jgi:hypothetical protein